MNLKGFGDIPKGLIKGIIVGVSILFFAGLFGFLYLPKIKEMRRITAEIDLVKKKIEKAKRIERDFKPPSQEEEKRWKEVESRLYSVIPPEKDIHELIYELADRAKRCNILNTSFKSGKKINTKVFEGRKEVSPAFSIQSGETFAGDADYFFVKLSFRSGYQDLACFLEEIQDIDRFLEMKSLVIKRNPPLISVEIVAGTCYGRRSEVGGQKSAARSQGE